MTRLPTACSEKKGRKGFGSVRVPRHIFRLKKKMQGGDQPTDWRNRNGICTVLSLTSCNRLLLLLSLLSLIPVQVPGVVTVRKGLAWSASVNREYSSSPKRKCWARDDSYRLFTDRFDSLSEEGVRWWRCVLFTNTLWLGNFLLVTWIKLHVQYFSSTLGCHLLFGIPNTIQPWEAMAFKHFFSDSLCSTFFRLRLSDSAILECVWRHSATGLTDTSIKTLSFDTKKFEREEEKTALLRLNSCTNIKCDQNNERRLQYWFRTLKQKVPSDLSRPTDLVSQLVDSSQCAIN